MYNSRPGVHRRMVGEVRVELSVIAAFGSSNHRQFFGMSSAQNIDRAKCEIGQDEIRAMFKRCFKTGCNRSAFAKFDDEQFAGTYPKLMKELAAGTPRLNEGVVERAYKNEYGGNVGDKHIPRDIAIAICSCFRYVRAKASRLKSGTRLPPHLWEVLKTMKDPPPALAAAKERGNKLQQQEENARIKRRRVDLGKAQEMENAQPEEVCGSPEQVKVSQTTLDTSPGSVRALYGKLDTSPGSVLALYGVDRSQVATHKAKRALKEQPSCVSISSASTDLAEASKKGPATEGEASKKGPATSSAMVPLAEAQVFITFFMFELYVLKCSSA
jgi:hypothetical protein